jgi:anti-sigma B factor antagonist
MQSNFLVETQTTGRATVVAPAGELDLVSSPALRQVLDTAIESEAELLVVDLRRLEFMDSTGLHALVQAQQRVYDSGRRFALVRGAAHVQRLLDLTGVAEFLTIVDSPDELLEIDQAPGPS